MRLTSDVQRGLTHEPTSFLRWTKRELWAEGNRNDRETRRYIAVLDFVLGVKQWKRRSLGRMCAMTALPNVIRRNTCQKARNNAEESTTQSTMSKAAVMDDNFRQVQYSTGTLARAGGATRNPCLHQLSPPSPRAASNTSQTLKIPKAKSICSCLRVTQPHDRASIFVHYKLLEP